MNQFTAAAIQLDSQSNKEENLKQIVSFIEEAAQKGAKLITMPENCNYVGLEGAASAEEVPGGQNLPGILRAGEEARCLAPLWQYL